MCAVSVVLRQRAKCKFPLLNWQTKETETIRPKEMPPKLLLLLLVSLCEPAFYTAESARGESIFASFPFMPISLLIRS